MLDGEAVGRDESERRFHISRESFVFGWSRCAEPHKMSNDFS